MNMRSHLTDEEKTYGNLVKATKVAICEFLAQHPSSVTDPVSMKREAKSILAYPISSRRHLRAMRSELDATVRELRRQVKNGYWTAGVYALLVADLKQRGLIDISAWHDTDADRMKQILKSGEIRTTAEMRLATEYRDTITDRQLLAQVDELVTSYESKRGLNSGVPSRDAADSKATLRESKLSPDDVAYVELLRRTAIASLEYAAQHGREGLRGKASMTDRANVWRHLKVVTRRDLKDLEQAFWIVLSKLRRNRLSQVEFERLAINLKESGLIDISKLTQRPRKATELPPP